MTMSAPGGAFQSIPGQVRPTVAGPAVSRRTGLLRIAAGSDHMITICPPDGAAIRMQVKARPRSEVPSAKAVHVCFHARCAGKSWPTWAAMAKDHPEPSKMAQSQETHLVGLWSEDPVGTKVADCADCKSSKSGPCPAHHGGVVGLIAPAEPKSDEG